MSFASTTNTTNTKAQYAALCQSCGACCAYYAQFKFGLNIVPGEAVPKKLVQIGPSHRIRTENNEIVPTTHYMRRQKNQQGWTVCTALQGIIGQQVSCKIYAERSFTCRQYDPGSDDCLHARQWAGLSEATKLESETT